MSFYIRRSVGAISCGILLVVSAQRATCQTPEFGVNLIVNGDAEAGVGSTSGREVPVPGWASTGGATAHVYVDFSGRLSPTSPGPANRGSNYFYGGNNSQSSSLAQLLDISAFGNVIDLGTVTYDFSGYLGGYHIENDEVIVSAHFRNSTGDEIGVSALGPVTAADRNFVSGIHFRQISGTLPIGTRSVNFIAESNRVHGVNCDGYWDNLEFVLRDNTQTIGSAKRALLIAAGINDSSPQDLHDLDKVSEGSSLNSIDVLDAAYLLRGLTGQQ